MICSKCGKENTDDAKLCLFCGAELETGTDSQFSNTLNNQSEQPSTVTPETSAPIEGIPYVQDASIEGMPDVQGDYSIAPTTKSRKPLIFIACGLIIVALIVVLLFTVGPLGNSSFVGKYTLVSMVEGEEEYGDEFLSVALGEDYVKNNYIEFKEDNKFTLSIMGTAIHGTFEKDGDKFTLSSESEGFNEELDATLDGDRFTIDQSGSKMIFEKQKS